jgi:hypothetical protein
VGKLADEHGLSVALMLVGGLPLVGALFAWLLPDQEQASEGSE